MSLAERAKGGPPRAWHGSRCSIGVALESLSGDDRAALESMLDHESGWTQRQIHEALEAEGVPHAAQSIGCHRRGQCSCARP